jgi:hypothetical protein
MVMVLVRAVARLNGSEVAGFWINAKTNGLVGDKLVDLGINGKRSEAVSKNKLGETVIHLGDGDLSPAMSKQLGVLLEGKTAEIVLSGSGGIRIIGVTSAEIKNSQLFSAGNSNRGSPSGHAPALDALSDFGLDSNLTVKIIFTKSGNASLAEISSLDRKGPLAEYDVATKELTLRDVDFNRDVRAALPGMTPERGKLLEEFAAARDGRGKATIAFDKEGKFKNAVFKGDDISFRQFEVYRDNERSGPKTLAERVMAKAAAAVQRGVDQLLGRGNITELSSMVEQAANSGKLPARREALLSAIVNGFERNGASADAKGKAVRDLQEAVEKSGASDEVKTFFAELVERVDREGCSTCTAKYTTSELRAEGWRGIYSLTSAETSNPGNDRTHQRWTADRMYQR